MLKSKFKGMKKILLITLLCLVTTILFAQRKKSEVGDSKIFTKVSDTSNLYIRVKRAIIKSGFTVRDDMNDSLLTSNTEVVKHLGYTIIRAKIKNDTVTVWGYYSNKNQNLLDVDIAAGKYNKIVCFHDNSGYGWDILHAIASDIDAIDLSYSK
jgi:hypothetical protein